jgi:phosphate starvation-inducible PhoH-like protein
MRAKKSISSNLPIITPKKNSKMLPLYSPRSDNQKQYVSALNNQSIPIVFGTGPAGCGKTLFACTTAINLLQSGSVQKIVLTRPIVPVEEEEIGFLPGSLVNKMDPWTRPFFDIFLEFYPQRDIDFMLASGVIEISPLAYMRGRTFKRCFIIADEMQNSTPNQMLMLLSRIGDGSKMVVTGDLKQSDRSLDNGLIDFMKKYKVCGRDFMEDDRGSIQLVEMTYGDIERSPIVSKVLEIYRNASRPVDDTLLVNEEVGDVADVVVNGDVLHEKSKIPINNDAALIPISHISKYLHR